MTTQELVIGWEATIERGPDWLFLRLMDRSGEHGGLGNEECADLAESVWEQIQQHFVTRVVLELDGVEMLHSRLIGQLVLLHKRLVAHGGILRICGLSPANEEALHSCRLDTRLPNYADRGEAVRGFLRPRQPR